VSSLFSNACCRDLYLSLGFQLRSPYWYSPRYY